jgi:ATP-dependent exoDNAse (exonuclease V) alpha subunit
VHDYTRKGGIVHTEILLPDHAPSAYADRAVLWNAVEKVERYKTAQLARDIEISLPVELSLEQNISLARRFVSEVFVNAGMCADICVHDKSDGNPHAHILLTMRPLDENGNWMQKSHTVNGRKIPTVDWNEHDRAEDWRMAWAAYANGALRLAGKLTEDNVLDHRSYERQGIDKEPTIHLGPAAHQMEKRGIRTDRGDINRAIVIGNREIRQLRARISKLEKGIAELSESTKQIDAHDIIFKLMSPHYNSAVARVKNAATIHNYCIENDISCVADMDRAVRKLQSRLASVSEEMKKTTRRVDTLTKRLEQGKHFTENRQYSREYARLYAIYTTAVSEKKLLSGRKAQKALDAANAYYEENRAHITLYQAAEKYLRDALQEHYNPKKLALQVAKWEKELAEKAAERKIQYGKYEKIKSEIATAEKIQRTIWEAQREEKGEQMRRKARSLER